MTSDTKALPLRTFDDLAHIPGPSRWRMSVPETLRFLADPLHVGQAECARYGPVYRVKRFGGWFVILVGAEANERILFDREQLFSTHQGWWPAMGRVFPNGLLLKDGADHRQHRRTLGVAFKPEPMRHYFDLLQQGIAARLATWPEEMAFYPAIKTLTLDLAASAFLGVSWGPDADAINEAFIAMVQAVASPIRTPLPGTALARGIKGRAYLQKFFAQEIPKRRGSSAQDLFTLLCNAQDEEGQQLSDQDIIDHMNFMMMAAHDTLTSSLSSLVYLLGKHPDWQEKLRAEAQSFPTLSFAQPSEMELTEMALRETLRLYPLVASIPRRTLRDFHYGGYDIPAGTYLAISPLQVHRQAEHWPDPERFDPLRFTPEQMAQRHKYAWVPFGGGAHMCLGLHFAVMQVRAMLHQLLPQREIILQPGYDPHFRFLPIPRPRDKLPLTLRRR